ncbi:hypothetical protein HYX11_02975 [Candidatus Woesearchaeota archaeon]|nr:hypothetical protein [Candidatus Woesearchaeota archaeon]
MNTHFKEYTLRKHPSQQMDQSYLEQVAAEVLRQSSLTPKTCPHKAYMFFNFTHRVIENDKTERITNYNNYFCKFCGSLQDVLPYQH